MPEIGKKNAFFLSAYLERPAMAIGRQERAELAPIWQTCDARFEVFFSVRFAWEGGVANSDGSLIGDFTLFIHSNQDIIESSFICIIYPISST